MKKNYKIPVFVLGMSVNGLGVVHSLVHSGVRVFACDERTDNPMMKTRYATSVQCPSPRIEPKKTLEFLLNLVKQHGGKAVLFPTSDAFNEFIHNHRKELAKNFLFIMPDEDLMDQLLSKLGQYDLAKKHGIPTPVTYSPASLEDVHIISEKLQYPVLIKGLNTTQWRERFGLQKGFVAKNSKELIRKYERIFFKSEVSTVVQEIIEGKDTDHYKFCGYVNRKDKMLLTFTLQKIRQYPCHFGIGSSVMSKWDPEVLEVGHKMMKSMGYRGIASIEFKKDARDNVFKLIEMNPRFWAQNSLATACGQNFALTAYLDLIGEKVDVKTDFENDIKWTGFKEDRASFLGYRKEGTLSFFQWVSSLLSGKKVWAIWAWDDPMPFLFDIKFGFVLFEKVFMKIGSLFSRNTKDSSDVEGIEIKVIDTFNDFKALKYVWNEILEKSKIKNPFLRHEWLSAWWNAYGDDKELFIVQFEKSGDTVGFAPLMKYKTKLTGLPLNAIGFITNHWTRMDFLLTEDKKECLDALCELLAKTGRVSILAQMNKESDHYEMFQKLLIEKGVSFREKLKQHSFIPLEGTWEDYFNKQSRNFRMDSRRKLKRLQKEGEVKLTHISASSADTVEQLKKISQNSWQSGSEVNIVTTKSGEEFYKEILNQWKDQDIFDCTILEVNQQPICYMVGLRQDGHYFAFDTAYDPVFDKYSPGLIIHNMLLERLYKEGVKCFDFGYVASYKRRWTDEVAPMSDITIYNKGLWPKTLHLANRMKGLVKAEK